MEGKLGEGRLGVREGEGEVGEDRSHLYCLVANIGVIDCCSFSCETCGLDCSNGALLMLGFVLDMFCGGAGDQLFDVVGHEYKTCALVVGEDRLLSLSLDGMVLEWELQKLRDSGEEAEPHVAHVLVERPVFTGNDDRRITCMQVCPYPCDRSIPVVS